MGTRTPSDPRGGAPTPSIPRLRNANQTDGAGVANQRNLAEGCRIATIVNHS
jgi:hypothetical protein